MRIHAALVVTAVVVSGACSSAHHDGGAAPATAESTVTTPANGQIGVRLRLHTHCGVKSTTIDGQLWLADPPISDGSDNPLPGWDQNDTDGTFVKLTETEAEFRAPKGAVAHFKRAAAGTRDPGAGCE